MSLAIATFTKLFRLGNVALKVGIVPSSAGEIDFALCSIQWLFECCLNRSKGRLGRERFGNKGRNGDTNTARQVIGNQQGKRISSFKLQRLLEKTDRGVRLVPSFG